MHARAVPAKLPLLSHNSRAQIHSPSPSSPRSLVMSRLHYRRPSLRVPSLSAKCFACSPARSLVSLRGNSRDQVVTSPARNEGWSWSCFENAPPRMFASIERATLMFSRLWDDRSWLDDFQHAKGDRWEFSGQVFQDLLHVWEWGGFFRLFRSMDEFEAKRLWKWLELSSWYSIPNLELEAPMGNM